MTGIEAAKHVLCVSFTKPHCYLFLVFQFDPSATVARLGVSPRGGDVNSVLACVIKAVVSVFSPSSLG